MVSDLNIRTRGGRRKQEDPELRLVYTGRPCLPTPCLPTLKELSTVSIEDKSLRTFEYICTQRYLKTMNTNLYNKDTIYNEKSYSCLFNAWSISKLENKRIKVIYQNKCETKTLFHCKTSLLNI